MPKPSPDDKKKPVISYDSFKLSFFEDTETDEQAEQLDAMESMVPRDCIFLGELIVGVGHAAMEWQTEDRYYVSPWTGPDYQWALFRISWDDNWSRYDWSGDARIRGVDDPREAARKMFTGLMDLWGYDLKAKDYAAYRKFLKQI